MMHVGDFLSTSGVFSTIGDIMTYVGDFKSTMGGVQYRGKKSFVILVPPRY